MSNVAVDMQLGPYKILAPLGAGGMGEVYRALDIRLGREVALKVLPEQFAADPLRLARFEREAKAVAALAHPNIVVLHDFGTDQGITYAVMELLEGQSLRDRMGPRALPWRKAVEIAVAVADGLAAAHAKGIVHRDLKPANVFVTSDERVKILDFGLAKVAESPPLEKIETQSYSPAQTKTGTILGTAPYMSPEQLRGQSADARSDLFSFGCVLYEMVAGKRPFGRRSDVETTAAILHDDPPELTDSGQKVPLELERLIRRCLEKNPEARFQSARDLAFALRSILNTGEVPLAPPASASRRTRPFLWFAAAFMLLAVVASAIYLLPRSGTLGQPEKPAEPVQQIKAIAVLPFVNESKDPDGVYLSDGIPGNITQGLEEIRNLEVRQLTSEARYFKGADTDLQEVARHLRVQAVLSGRISKRKDLLTVTYKLVDTRDMTVLLIRQFEYNSADLQEHVAKIAKEICTKLHLQLTGAEDQRLARRDTTSPEAYELYCKGLFHRDRFNSDGQIKSLDCFKQAVEKDPEYAKAWARLAMSYMNVANFYSMPRAEARPKARQAAQKALELDAHLGDAHYAMACLQFNDFDWTEAEKEFKLAIELSPNLAAAHHFYGIFLSTQGKFEKALAEIHRANELDRLKSAYLASLASVYYYQREYKKAIDQADSALELDPNLTMAHGVKAWCNAMTGHYPEALKEIQKCRELEDFPSFLADVGTVHAMSGDKPEARKVLEELKAMKEKGRDVDPDCFFLLYACLDEKSLAFETLQQMYDERSDEMAYLKVVPLYDLLRSDPRFDDWLRKMKFPP